MGSTILYSDADQITTTTATFTQGGAVVDPTAASISLIVTDPQNNQTTYTYGGAGTIQKVSTGVYAQTVASAIDGLWQAEWKAVAATGVLDPGTDVQVFTWTVFPPTAGRWYCSLAEVKSRLGKTTSDSDFEINLAIQAAARDIEGFCGRYFWQGPDTRTYVPEDLWQQTTDDIVSVTSLTLDFNGQGVYDQTWVLGTDFVLEVSERDYNQAASGELRPFTQIRAVNGKFFPFIWPFVHMDRVKVQGTFGWPAVPPMVKQACLLIASDLFKLREAPFGQAGFAEYGVAKSTAEPMIADMLRPYVSSRRKVGV